MNKKDKSTVGFYFILFWVGMGGWMRKKRGGDKQGGQISEDFVFCFSRFCWFNRRWPSGRCFSQSLG